MCVCVCERTDVNVLMCKLYCFMLCCVRVRTCEHVHVCTHAVCVKMGAERRLLSGHLYLALATGNRSGVPMEELGPRSATWQARAPQGTMLAVEPPPLTPHREGVDQSIL